jgi:hypothetical protein
MIREKSPSIRLNRSEGNRWFENVLCPEVIIYFCSATNTTGSSNFPIYPLPVAGYSYRRATIGSTRAALLAGTQHASTPVASNNKTVLARVTGS